MLPPPPPVHRLASLLGVRRRPKRRRRGRPRVPLAAGVRTTSSWLLVGRLPRLLAESAGAAPAWLLGSGFSATPLVPPRPPPLDGSGVGRRCNRGGEPFLLRTGSRKHELKSKQKLEKKLSFYTKVKDTVTSLNAKKAISKKKKQRSSQKKLKAYDFSALSKFLPETAASQQQTEVKLNCKSKLALVQRESAQLNAKLNNPQFQLDPFAAIHQHLVSTQPPSSMKDDDSAKHGKKSRKKKKNASSTSQSMDI